MSLRDRIPWEFYENATPDGQEGVFPFWIKDNAGNWWKIVEDLPHNSQNCDEFGWSIDPDESYDDKPTLKKRVYCLPVIDKFSSDRPRERMKSGWAIAKAHESFREDPSPYKNWDDYKDLKLALAVFTLFGMIKNVTDKG